MIEQTKITLYCSFCGKSQYEVRKLISGPTVFICNECALLCAGIVQEETQDTHLTDLIPNRVLQVLEYLPVESIEAMLRSGGLRAADALNPFNAREVLEAVVLGISIARTQVDMTEERAHAIQQAEIELKNLMDATRNKYNRDAEPIQQRLKALKRGDPLDSPQEIVAFAEGAPPSELSAGLEISTLAKQSGPD